MNCRSTLSLGALTALAPLMLAASVMLAAGSAQAETTHHHKVVKTTITLRAATQIGNTILSPGKYEVKIAPASGVLDDPTVLFSMLSIGYTDELNWPYSEDVILTVQASQKKLDAPAPRTEFVLGSGDSKKASALEIRGSSTEYVFEPKTTSMANGQ